MLMTNTAAESTLLEASTNNSDHGLEAAVVVLYTNYRGETALRRIIPRRIWYGSTAWHPDAGWLMDAFDLEKGAERSFAMKDIRVWTPELK